MSITVLLSQVLIIFLEIGIGTVAVKVGVLDDKGSKMLSNLIMTITLPCTLLASADVKAGGNTVLLMLLGFVLLEALYILSAVVCLAIAKKLGLSQSKKAVFIAVAVLPNSAFIGIPLATSILGEAVGMVYAAAGFIAYNIFFFTYVVQLFQPGKKMKLKSLVTPTNVTTVLMVVMLLTGFHLTGPLQKFVSAVGACTTPLALMVVGVMLAYSDIRAIFRDKFLYLISLLRCVIFPLAFLLVLYFAGFDRTMSMGVTILACCPSGSLGAVLAKQYDMEPELASQAVAQSTLFIVITVPVLLLLAGTLFGIS